MQPCGHGRVARLVRAGVVLRCQLRQQQRGGGAIAVSISRLRRPVLVQQRHESQVGVRYSCAAEQHCAAAGYGGCSGWPEVQVDQDGQAGKLDAYREVAAASRCVTWLGPGVEDPARQAQAGHRVGEHLRRPGFVHGHDEVHVAVHVGCAAAKRPDQPRRIHKSVSLHRFARLVDPVPARRHQRSSRPSTRSLLPCNRVRVAAWPSPPG